MQGGVWNGMEEWWHAGGVLHGTAGHRTGHSDVPPCVTFLSESIAKGEEVTQPVNARAASGVFASPPPLPRRSSRSIRGHRGEHVAQLPHGGEGRHQELIVLPDRPHAGLGRPPATTLAGFLPHAGALVE